MENILYGIVNEGIVCGKHAYTVVWDGIPIVTVDNFSTANDHFLDLLENEF